MVKYLVMCDPNTSSPRERMRWENGESENYLVQILYKNGSFNLEKLETPKLAIALKHAKNVADNITEKDVCRVRLYDDDLGLVKEWIKN